MSIKYMLPVGKSRLPSFQEGPFLPPIRSSPPPLPNEWVNQTRAKEWIDPESMQERIRQLCTTQVMNTVQLRSQRGIVLAEKAKKQHLDKWTPNGRLQQPAPENRYTVIQEPKFLGFTKAKAMENFLWRESKKPRPKKRVKRGDEMRFY